MGGGLEGTRLEALLSAANDAGLDLAGALRGTDDDLRPTEIAQPALLATEVALLDSLSSEVEIVGVAGHSVGEYAAAVAAGALTPGGAMALVVERGRLMAGMRSGTMSALLGMDAEIVGAICAEVTAAGTGQVVVANLNAPGQTVVSGDVEAVAAVEEIARNRGCRRAVRLNVSGAFHSPLMHRASEQFAPLLDAAAIESPRTPVVCNVDAQAVTGAAELRSRLKQQLTAPVRWTDCVARLVELGAEALVEVGPGAVLTGLARRIAPGVRAIAVNTPQQVGSLGQAVELPS